ncbi:hypothetical protein B0T25DRAFT_498900 [Lasiosphaeria hispida]|uniref:Pyruvate dehydrogenase protein x component n=1 Tax=Lasiosphaeria hispida TaxID=260671 RepID=A0AAJ0HMG5_9PEZI|nr:hypothetical protein B0T25DRAFT_498900 [Lasiosphaeria hispida]
MASFAAAACRASVRLARHQLHRDAAAKGFRTSAAALAAQNFTMPALSPTMTEGNIATWQVKEGEKFSAGDVLLEIETDKATMDVEAQEDGFLMKIMKGDGSKGVQVGTRIAVIAEEGDDISTLEIPADGNAQNPAAAEASKPDAPTASESQSAPSTASAPKAPKTGGRTPNKAYPLLPSVIHLLKDAGLDASAIDSVTPTGPNGRVLKGDVLAFLGKINSETPSENETRFVKASHLDLSNIKVAKAPEAKPEKAVAAPTPAPAAPKDAVLKLAVSVAAVSAVQKKLQSQLGLELPFSSFVIRAADIANEKLPRAKASPDRFFNELLGLESESDYFSRGSYLPDIGTARSVSSAPKPVQAKGLDILDILAGNRSPRATTAPKVEVSTSGALTTFSLQVPSEEAERATIFLERVKVLLEKEPDKLVL